MNQIWLRHKNGGGKKYGNDCEVSADTYLDRKSSVGDAVEVYTSLIYGSLITNDSLVSNARIHSSTIKDQCRIVGSGPGVNIVNSELTGNTRVWGHAVIMDVTLENVRVYGNAILQGPWELREFVRVHRGIWLKPPRYVLIDAENIDTVISECVPGFAHIGCFCRSYTDWFRPGYRQMIGKRSGWTSQQVEFTFDTFSTWASS